MDKEILIKLLQKRENANKVLDDFIKDNNLNISKYELAQIAIDCALKKGIIKGHIGAWAERHSTATGYINEKGKFIWQTRTPQQENQ